MLQAILTGNIGNDAEQKYTAQGTALLRFNVASNYKEKNQSGEYEDRVEWVRCTLMGQRGEALAQYLTKGTRVTVVGQLKARPWVGQTDQVLHAGLEILVSEVDFSTPREGGNGHQERPSGQPARPRQTAANGSNLANVPEGALPF